MSRYIFSLSISLIILSVPLLFAASDSRSGESLIKKCNDLTDRYDYANLLRAAQDLLAAGEREKNERILAYGHVNLGGAQLMAGDSKEARENLHAAISIGEKIGNDTLLSIAYNTLGIYEANVGRNLYLAQRYFYKSRHHAKEACYSRIERSIGSNLAELAIEMNDTSGIKYARECYDYGVESGQPRFEYVGALNLSELYNIKGDFPLARKYSTIAMSLARMYDYHNIGQINLLNSVIYLATGEYAKAGEFAQEAIANLAGEHPTSLPKAYLMYAMALRHQGDYSGSLLQLSKGVEAAHKYSAYSCIDKLYELMADNYESNGEKEQALKYIRLSKDSAESHHLNDRKRMDQERSLLLDLEENENRIKLQNIQVESQKRLILSLSAGILLLVALLVIVAVNFHKRKKLYESIVAQNRKIVELRDELLSGRSIESSEDELQEDDPESGLEQRQSLGAQKAEELYAQLCSLMKEERLYANLRMTREMIIERLGTNRTYLTQVISRHGWTNYSQFVNSFRIDEAIRILSDKTRTDIKVSTLYSELGFGSQATFYKTFTAATGVSPVVFKKSVS